MSIKQRGKNIITPITLLLKLEQTLITAVIGEKNKKKRDIINLKYKYFGIFAFFNLKIFLTK